MEDEKVGTLSVFISFSRFRIIRLMSPIQDRRDCGSVLKTTDRANSASQTLSLTAWLFDRAAKSDEDV